jgi:hypothetical protein
MFIAGTIATVLETTALAQSRAGLPGVNFIDFNRYLQSVALPSTLALVPAFATIGRTWLARRPHLEQSRVVPCIAPTLAVAAFILGVEPMRSYQISTQLLRELIQRGALDSTSSVQPDPAVVNQMCSQPASTD